MLIRIVRNKQNVTLYALIQRAGLIATAVVQCTAENYADQVRELHKQAKNLGL